MSTKIPQDLQKLAQESIAKLGAQFPDKAPAGTQEPVDLYAEFREGAVNSDTNIPKQESVKLQERPDSQQTNPVLKYTPDEEYYQQEQPELAPYEEELFPGGPTRSQIESWKKQYPDSRICVTEIVDRFFVFKTINRFQYKQLVALEHTNPIQREEIICENCTLWPANYTWETMATEDGGIPSTYAQIIMEQSGFTKDYVVQVL